MANVPSSPILVTVMMVALWSFETSVISRATWHNIPEDVVLHSYRRENLKSYNIHRNCLFEVRIGHIPVTGIKTRVNMGDILNAQGFIWWILR
jgi:hypothetical protein